MASASNPGRVSAPTEPLAMAAGLGIDVGGAGSYEGLRTLWKSTKTGEAELPEEAYPVVTVRENGKTHGVELRLVIGPIADVELASRLCGTLSAAHHYCQPVAFEGQRLSLIDTGPAVKAAPRDQTGADQQSRPRTMRRSRPRRRPRCSAFGSSTGNDHRAGLTGPGRPRRIAALRSHLSGPRCRHGFFSRPRAKPIGCW